MAPESEIATRILAGIAAHLKREVSTIHPNLHLRNDLCVDSLDMIELLFKIEETFDLEISNADLVALNTIGEVIAYVERRLGTPASVAPSAG